MSEEFFVVDLRGVEPRLRPCHGRVIPLHYRPRKFNLYYCNEIGGFVKSHFLIYITFSKALVAQRIEHLTPNETIEVQFLARAQFKFSLICYKKGRSDLWSERLWD